MVGTGGPCRKRSSRRPADLFALLATAALFAAPTPVVSLDSLIAPPPTSYVPHTETNGIPVGAFDAGAYARYLSAGDGSSTASSLTRDGFAGGFGASWTEQTTGRGLEELVVAFAGARGARSWLLTAEAAARASAYFVRRILVAGIGRSYYGLHYADPTGPSYADVVSFVKGNNFFMVGFSSSADDLGDLVVARAKAQFDYAAADSIPPALWPENLVLLNGGVAALRAAAVAAVTVVVVGFLLSFGLFFYVRRGTSKPADAKLSLDENGPPPDG